MSPRDFVCEVFHYIKTRGGEFWSRACTWYCEVPTIQMLTVLDFTAVKFKRKISQHR